MEITYEVLIKLGIEPLVIINKKHGPRPELTAFDIVSRVILGGSYSTKDQCFPEFSHYTSTKILRKVFGNINLCGSMTWYLHALSILNKIYCTKCNSIVSIDTFNRTKALCQECISIKNHEYYISHKSDFKAKQIAYLYRRNIATPSWQTRSELNLFYHNKPDGYHVDHIIPLKHELVCGLHVIANLQYLIARDNIIKSNKFDLNNYNQQNNT